MERLAVIRFCLIVFYCTLMMATGCSSSSSSQNEGPDTELLSVVAISRHGIRSPTSSNTSMNLYTLRSEGFPEWPAPAIVPGYLTTVGFHNASLLGGWYRDYYAAQGLLPPRGTCPAQGTVFVYADVAERTMNTAQGYVYGLFQSEESSDCGVQVNHWNGPVPIDPYIATQAAGVCQINTTEDLAAFNAKIGSVASLINTYSSQLEMLQDVTQCCQPSACGSSEDCSLLDLATTVTTSGSVGFASGTLFYVADTVTETFELEYAQGMPETDCETTPGSPCVGWGIIPSGGLYDMTKLHVMNMGLSCSLPSCAQVGSTNLMTQVAGTMDQALTGVKNPDMLAPSTSKFTLFVAHDENLLTIAAFLGGVTWKAEGFQQNDPGPAGALVFELHRVRETGQLIVRLFYVIASLDQMRNGTTLSLETPPQRIPLQIPACSGLYDCPYDQFKTFITDNVRQDCIFTAGSEAG
jgi:4-phytase/acid phosphatase